MVKQSRARQRKPGNKPPAQPFTGGIRNSTPGYKTLAQVIRQRLRLSTRHEHRGDEPAESVSAVAAWSVDVECSCGKVFALQPPIPEGDEPALTGDWVLGACPNCKRAHRLRLTIVANVEEELEAKYQARMRALARVDAAVPAE